MDNAPLTDEEIAKIRALLPFADSVREEAEYDAAKKLVLRRWKAMVIGLATIVAAIVLLWNHLKAAIQATLGS